MAFNHKDWLKDEPVVKTLRFEDNLGAGYFKYNTGEIIPGIIAYGLASTDGNLPVFVRTTGNDDGSIYLMSFRGGDCYGSYEEYREDSFLYEGEDELGYYRVHWLGLDFTPELDAYMPGLLNNILFDDIFYYDQWVSLKFYSEGDVFVYEPPVLNNGFIQLGMELYKVRDAYNADFIDFSCIDDIPVGRMTLEKEG